MTASADTYVRIISVLVPIYLVILIGYFAGHAKMVDGVTMDKLNGFVAKFALPALLFRTIGSADLYSADWRVIQASLVFKVITAVVIAALCGATRARCGPAAERALVWHSVLTFPNYVVIGGPVLSAIFDPAVVRLFMGLLLLEQVSIHLTAVAVVAQMFVLTKPPAASAGEHSHGSAHADGPPAGSDAAAWTMPAQLRALDVPPPLAAASGGEHDAWGGRVSVSGATELKTRSHHARTDSGSCGGLSRTLSGGAPSSPRGCLERIGSHNDFALLEDEETGAAAAAPAEQASSDEAEGSESGNKHGHSHGHRHGAPPPAPVWMETLYQVGGIVRDRLGKSPLVQGAVLGVAMSLALKGTDRTRKLPFIIDQTALYLHNCVLGTSLFNFGLFTHLNGMMPCGLRKTLVIVIMRSIVCPLATLLVLLLFRVRGEELRLLVMSAALPQALSSFVVFKEFKIQPEVFSTSMTVGTVLCLPVVCIWYYIVTSF